MSDADSRYSDQGKDLSYVISLIPGDLAVSRSDDGQYLLLYAGRRWRMDMMQSCFAIAAIRLGKSALATRRNARHTLPLRSLSDCHLRSWWIALLAWPALAAAQYPPTPGGSAIGVPATGGCEVQAVDEAARVRCAMESVRQVDSRLNAEYIDLKSKLKGGEVSGLTETQRTWIRMRDQSCQLARDIRDRDAWLQHVAASAARTACVLIATNRRIGELERLRRQVDGIVVPADVEPPADKPRVLEGMVKTDAVTSANLHRHSVRAQSSGRLYFEDSSGSRVGRGSRI